MKNVNFSLLTTHHYTIKAYCRRLLPYIAEEIDADSEE